MPSKLPQRQPSRQIVAMGGGGWGMEPDNPLLDQYIYGLSNKEEPQICFVPTASGDSEQYINRFYQHFVPKPCRLSHLSLFDPPTSDLKTFIFNQDIIYVGGGNTKNLIALWQEWQLDHIFREAWNRGIILCGVSAGSLCWFEQGVTDSIPGARTVLKCLGLLPGSNCPHYDWEAYKSGYHRLLSQELINEGYAADDGVALHFVGNKLINTVSSRPEAKAYYMKKRNGKVVETTLKTKYLG
jgi:dipeptidase E